ncbi:hypothetical protein [Kineococcus indalonis]|uniref:hypothetical protein n=1 Tax=Kineococcus indalonis TaxID=2696566 RepID=UPI001412F60B|nr:hypothetical protein [Kineococcus indalonis]NAZ85091.1 hypothetical protein [Kineococcus indalonis]
MIDLLNVATPPWEEDLLAAAAPGGLVDVWSLTRTERIATLETVWGSGVGWRGALVPGERPVVVAGAWERHGVCGYDLSGERLWQDRSRTNVEAVTALAGGRVVVTHLRRATRVLQAATGEEVRPLRGVLRVIPLTPDLSLGVGGGWCRLLDRSLDPTGPRIATGLSPVWSAATDGEHLMTCEIGGPLRILDPEGRERARWTDHFRHLVHDPVTATWVVVHETDEGQASLLRLDYDAAVLDRQPCERPRDVATTRAGRSLILLTDNGVRVVDCSDWSTRVLGDA